MVARAVTVVRSYVENACQYHAVAQVFREGRAGTLGERAGGRCDGTFFDACFEQRAGPGSGKEFETGSRVRGQGQNKKELEGPHEEDEKQEEEELVEGRLYGTCAPKSVVAGKVLVVLRIRQTGNVSQRTRQFKTG